MDGEVKAEVDKSILTPENIDKLVNLAERYAYLDAGIRAIENRIYDHETMGPVDALSKERNQVTLDLRNLSSKMKYELYKAFQRDNDGQNM